MKRFLAIFFIAALSAFAAGNPMSGFMDAILTEEAEAASNRFTKAAIAGEIEAMIAESHPEMLSEITEMGDSAQLLAEKVVTRLQPMVGYKLTSGKIAKDPEGRDIYVGLWTGKTKQKKSITFLLGVLEVDRKMKIRLILFDDQAKRFFRNGTVE